MSLALNVYQHPSVQALHIRFLDQPADWVRAKLPPPYRVVLYIVINLWESVGFEPSDRFAILIVSCQRPRCNSCASPWGNDFHS